MYADGTYIFAIGKGIIIVLRSLARTLHGKKAPGADETVPDVRQPGRSQFSTNSADAKHAEQRLQRVNPMLLPKGTSMRHITKNE